MRFPLEVLDGIRAVWPNDKPISVRISATDWLDGGITPADAVEIAKAFCDHGADIIDVSAGQVSRQQKPVYGRMFQTPFSDLIRNSLGIRTMAVGNIFEPDHVNSILAAGQADLCLLARPHLADPHWTLRAVAQLGYAEQWWPPRSMRRLRGSWKLGADGQDHLWNYRRHDEFIGSPSRDAVTDIIYHRIYS